MAGYPVLPTLAAARAFAGMPLVSDPAFERLACAAARLPDTCSGGFFECHLGHPARRVDVLVALRAAHDRPWVGRSRGGFSPDGIGAFYRAWADPASPLHGVPLTLLEIDLDEEPPPRSSLNFHFCVDPSFPAHGWMPPPGAPAPLDQPALAALVTEVLAVVSGAPPHPGILATLEQVRAALPPGGRLLHVSVMLSRPGAPLKLNAVVPPEALVRWLEDSGYPGHAGEVAGALDRLAPWTRVAKVDLALGVGLGPRIGLEIAPLGEPRGDTQWSALLANLVAAGACTPAEANALLDWPGADEVTLHGTGWPARLWRSLEIKLVFSRGVACDALKAYLGFTPSLSLLRETS
jgi:hypothetical protein